MFFKSFSDHLTKFSKGTCTCQPKDLHVFKLGTVFCSHVGFRGKEATSVGTAMVESTCFKFNSNDIIYCFKNSEAYFLTQWPNQ